MPCIATITNLGFFWSLISEQTPNLNPDHLLARRYYWYLYMYHYRKEVLHKSSSWDLKTSDLNSC